MNDPDRDLAVRSHANPAAQRTSSPLDTGPEESFDRLTELAARLLEAPVAVICLVDGERDVFKSAHGFAELRAKLDGFGAPTFCRIGLRAERPVIVRDARVGSPSREMEMMSALGVVAYAGVALNSVDGAPVGSFSVMDFAPREWTDAEVGVLKELAVSAEREIRLRVLRRELAVRADESRALIDQLQVQTEELEAQAEELEQQVEEVEELNADLTASEQRFRALAEADPDGIITIDGQSTILYANAAIARIFGHPEEELIGRSLETLIPERFRASHRAGIARYLATGTKNIPWRGIQLPGLRSDGTEIPIEINFGEYTAKGRQVFAGFITDITERKQAEEALKQAKDEAERANHAKSEFLSRMSHELRTPLNSILGFGQLLARDELLRDQAKGVEHILKAGRHLLDLINEVLEIARIEANQQEFSLEPVRARDVVEEALALIRPTAQQASIRVAFTGPSRNAEVCVRADQQRLMQVMLNLLSNAVKYNSPNGSVDVIVRREGTPASGGTLAIGVRDTGPGIPAERMAELFVPFSRLGAEEAGIEGTGLGLVLSKRLVEAMGGQLRVESQPGRGSTFWLELPLVDDPREQAMPMPRGRVEDLQQAHRPPRTIVYMEDNLANLDLVETILESRPEIHLIPALKGRLGLQLAKEHDPDLILLDLHLPDLHGEVVLQELSADPRTRGIPVLVISADATPRQVERIRAFGVHGYLTKPIDVEQFLAAVDAGLMKTTSATSAKVRAEAT